LSSFPGFPLRVLNPLCHTTVQIAAGTNRVSQVLNASLYTCHALSGPRQTLRNLASTDSFVLASGSLTPSPSAFFL